MLDALWNFLRHQLENAVVSAGLTLGLAGAGAALASRAPRIVRYLVETTLITSVTVDDRSDLFDELLEWLAGQPYSSRCRRARADLHQPRDGQERIILTPDGSAHLFSHRGIRLQVDRLKEPRDGSRFTGGPSESLRIRALTPRVSFLRDLLTEVHREHGDPERSRIAVYGVDGTQEWSRLAFAQKRPMATLVLAAGLAEALVADARTFLAGGQWYADRGVPWRRGYLLHGPPGTGKTSLVKALAGELGLGISVLSMTAERLDDTRLTLLLAEAPARSILLFEDVDALFDQRRRGEAAAGITFSGLLNALDGVMAQEGRILCMTTNHPDRLDPALVRPGRIDCQFAIGLPDQADIARLFLAFFPGEEAFAQRFAAAAAYRGLSPAALQGHFLVHRDDPAGALEHLAVADCRQRALM